MTELASDQTNESSPTTSFSILRCGATEPGGPYSTEQILQMLKEGAVSKKDLVYYEGMPDWRPIEEVFEIQETISHLIDDGQNPEEVTIAFREVSNVINDDEEIYYIAIQARAGILTKTKQCLVITDQHLYHLTEKGAGYELEAHPWPTVSNTKMQDNQKELGIFSFVLNEERRVDVPNIPMAQIQRLFELSCEMKS